MDLTVEAIRQIAGVVILALGIMAWVEKRFRDVEKAAESSAAKIEADCEKRDQLRRDELLVMQKDLADFKVHAAEQFASHQHLKDVEARLTGSIDRLTNRVEQLPTQTAELVRQALSAANRRG